MIALNLTLRVFLRYNPEGVDYYFNLNQKNKIQLLHEMENTAVGIVHPNLLQDLWRMKYDDSKHFRTALGVPPLI